MEQREERGVSVEGGGVLGHRKGERKYWHVGECFYVDIQPTHTHTHMHTLATRSRSLTCQGSHTHTHWHQEALAASSK